MIISIGLAVSWYLLIIFAVSNVMSEASIAYSMKNGLVTADAMTKAFNSDAMGKVLIIGGMCGIITSWNSFLLGGSRALYSMGESKMLPSIFSKLHPKYKTPTAALLLIGAACFAAPFFGKPVLVWLVDAASFGCCIAYLMVSISFVILRKKEPEMNRPYKVKHGETIGITAIILSTFLSLLYIIPLPFARSVYGSEFGVHVDIELDKELIINNGYKNSSVTI